MITIHTLALGNMDNFIYIIADSESQQAMVVDPAWDTLAIKNYLDKQQLILTGILLTHSHGDHVNGVDSLLSYRTVPVYISEEEFKLGLVSIKNPKFIAHHTEVALGEYSIKVLLTPGHTLGSVCYLIEGNLIAGDTLFVNGCGRCNFTESDVEQMFGSMQQLKKLDDNTIIFPGHNYGDKPNSTIGEQKQTNPFMLIEDKDFFVKFRMDLHGDYRKIPFPPSNLTEIQAIQAQHCL